MAVSYTHLDVYKRQYYKSMIKANGSCIAAFDKAIIQGSEGAEVISEDAKYVYVRLGSGSWVIEVM